MERGRFKVPTQENPKMPIAQKTKQSALMIESRPGVCGGAMCVAGTRIPVWMLLEARDAGASNEQLLEMFPTLKKSHLVAAWEFVEKNEELVRREQVKHQGE
jgi:uncharacterized protein (DUF433 family)